MTEKVANSLYNFRKSFRILHKEALNWFPGHMGKGLKQMQQKLKLVDCVIEVHDARIPLSGRNPHFRYTVCGVKPHILVLNKKDLTDTSNKVEVENVLRKNGIEHVLYTNSKNYQRCSGIKQIVPTLCKLISSSDRYNRNEEKDYCVMIIGVPNVGKSSLINALRAKYIGKGNAAPVGAVPGITRSVQTRIKVSENPLVYLLDTPGILTPNISDAETGLRLALCACLQDHLVGPIVIADYLLYWLNKTSNFSYVEYMGVEDPVDDIMTVLTKGANKLGKSQKIRSVDGSGYVHIPDFDAAAFYFVKAFRTGKLGKIMLDTERLNSW